MKWISRLSPNSPLAGGIVKTQLNPGSETTATANAGLASPLMLI